MALLFLNAASDNDFAPNLFPGGGGLGEAVVNQEAQQAAE
jgi:hypothetical protein